MHSVCLYSRAAQAPVMLQDSDPTCSLAPFHCYLPETSMQGTSRA